MKKVKNIVSKTKSDSNSFIIGLHNFLFSYKKGTIDYYVGVLMSWLVGLAFYSAGVFLYLGIVSSLIVVYVFWVGWSQICLDTWRKKEYFNKL